MCEYCLIHESDTFLGCQVEHIISEKHSGQTVESNLALACVFCNRHKGSDVATIIQETGRFCRLFNPRTDRWDGHFHLEGTRIVGLTEIGQGTAMLLGFNHPDRLLEREALMAAGRFPSEPARRRMSPTAKQ